LTTYLLGMANVVVMFLALRHHARSAAIAGLLLQIPWLIWDTANHYYGFYLIAVATVAIGVYTLWRERNAVKDH
jgi:hypothetical protein